ncbi:flagellar hook-length control protein FliK [Algicola sagamiensis]|uniref:flagellar hook-length control protein FliK n=1 Tax=Algicola sagamiensis TaxID=163869 RepID=UPI00146D9A8F|nr:flagellar hook-length control protein FliK [Algicola sagamiensis]
MTEVSSHIPEIRTQTHTKSGDISEHLQTNRLYTAHISRKGNQLSITLSQGQKFTIEVKPDTQLRIPADGKMYVMKDTDTSGQTQLKFLSPGQIQQHTIDGSQALKNAIAEQLISQIRAFRLGIQITAKGMQTVLEIPSLSIQIILPDKMTKQSVNDLTLTSDGKLKLHLTDGRQMQAPVINQLIQQTLQQLSNGQLPKEIDQAITQRLQQLMGVSTQSQVLLKEGQFHIETAKSHALPQNILLSFLTKPTTSSAQVPAMQDIIDAAIRKILPDTAPWEQLITQLDKQSTALQKAGLPPALQQLLKSTLMTPQLNLTADDLAQLHQATTSPTQMMSTSSNFLSAISAALGILFRLVPRAKSSQKDDSTTTIKPGQLKGSPEIQSLQRTLSQFAANSKFSQLQQLMQQPESIWCIEMPLPGESEKEHGSVHIELKKEKEKKGKKTVQRHGWSLRLHFNLPQLGHFIAHVRLVEESASCDFVCDNQQLKEKIEQHTQSLSEMLRKQGVEQFQMKTVVGKVKPESHIRPISSLHVEV